MSLIYPGVSVNESKESRMLNKYQETEALKQTQTDLRNRCITEHQFSGVHRNWSKGLFFRGPPPLGTSLPFTYSSLFLKSWNFLKYNFNIHTLWTYTLNFFSKYPTFYLMSLLENRNFNKCPEAFYSRSL